MLALIFPGVLAIYLYKPELVIQLDVVKLVLFAGALTAPATIAPFLVSVIIGAMIDRSEKFEKSAHGDYTEWFLFHGVGAAGNLYAALFIAYIFEWAFLKWCWLVVALTLLSVFSEVFRVWLFIKNPEAHIKFTEER